jgi:hypothetical protein
MARVRQSRSGRSQFCSSGRERATGSLVIPPREQQTPEALGAYQKAEIETWWPVIKGGRHQGGGVIPTPQNADSSFRGADSAGKCTQPAQAWLRVPANPESIVTAGGYGFRLSPLRGSAGMTNSAVWYEADLRSARCCKNWRPPTEAAYSSFFSRHRCQRVTRALRAEDGGALLRGAPSHNAVWCDG